MATKYRDKITTLCAKMFAIRSQVHPANQHAVDKYLQTVWKKISTLGNSVVRTTQPESLQDRFKSYVEAEEQRLREGLETVKYDIDAVDTLLLVTGPGRIEKNLFPLLWLLLRRDFEIFRLCRTTVIHKDELWDSADTLLWLFDAVTDRHDDLQGTFRNCVHATAIDLSFHTQQLYSSNRTWILDRSSRPSRAKLYVGYLDRPHVR